MKQLLIMCAALFITSSFAGGRDIGNGGYVLICGDQIELLDSYEARVRHKRPVDFEVDADSTVAARVEVALQKVKAIDPDFESILRAQTSKLLTLVDGAGDESKLHADVAVKVGEVFDGTPDFGDLWRPEGCQPVRVANQAKPNFPDERFYTFRKDLWTRLNPDQQAMLIVHEAIYNFLASIGQTTSVKTRYLTGYLSSAIGRAQLSNLKDYLELSRLIGRSEVTHRGLRCQMSQATDYTFNDTQTQLKACKVASGVTISLGSMAADAIYWQGCKANKMNDKQFRLVWRSFSSTWATFHENPNSKSALKELLMPSYADNGGTFKIQKANGEFLPEGCFYEANPFATVYLGIKDRLSVQLSEDGQLEAVFSNEARTRGEASYWESSSACKNHSLGNLTMHVTRDLERPTQLSIRTTFDKEMFASSIHWTPLTSGDNYTYEILKLRQDGLSGSDLKLDKNQPWSFTLNKNGCPASASGPFEATLMSVTETIFRPYNKSVLLNGVEPRNSKTEDGLIEYPFELRVALSATGQKLSIRLVDSKNPGIRLEGVEVNVGKTNYGKDKSGEIWADGAEPMGLDDQNQISQVTLSRPLNFTNRVGKKVILPAGSRVTLDKNGEIDKNAP